ncbi:hypothetical protein EB796_012594 [Bugula neritina]|uniref:Uncharacterized protein n=1 Tax=Bugula neritina TaxID=10212 RepID=A0A7J7JRX8_BUGNE|nr:hypothetical protein EB796_012594 [Bugula neritina]
MLLNSLLPIALHYTIFLQGLFILNRCPGESYNVKHSVIFLQIFFDLVRQINRKQPDTKGGRSGRSSKSKCSIL